MRKGKIVRLVIENVESRRIGTAEPDRKIIDAGPVAPTREPQLTKPRPEYEPAVPH
jgi:hypothetical protein